ncbi:MAG TPA: DNA double-strand break repair nuclease NurA [Anaerolineales bacterium]
MTLDYREVQKQVHELGKNAQAREAQLKAQRERARNLLAQHAVEQERLRQRVAQVVSSYEATLRCALPVSEPLDAAFPEPSPNEAVTVIAADGSQINPDRHAEVNYALVNAGAIVMVPGGSQAPQTQVTSQLFYEEDLYTATGTLTEDLVALRRDLNERAVLLKLALSAQAPVITLTDGPMELWGAKGADTEGAAEYKRSLENYQNVLKQLCNLKAVTAGYVDKPGADLVVRLLEVACTPDDELKSIRTHHPLRGCRDIDLFRSILQPGDRSAVFQMQSKSMVNYPGELAIHFFYINVGRPDHPKMARVEIPAWVAQSSTMLDDLHATLANQCRIMGAHSFPYLLHRAHETAVVTLQDQQQVTNMIIMELRNQGVSIGEGSGKQAAKDLPGRTRYGV